MVTVTFTPLAGNRYRVNGSGKSRIIKKAQIKALRRQIENMGRKRLPKLVPIESLKSVNSYIVPDHVECPNCQTFGWFRQFGRNTCANCNKPFNMVRLRF